MRIVIADDEPLARARLRALLEELGGYEIIGEAVNGKQVLEILKVCVPDLLLLDIGMPGINGMEVARRLAELPKRPALIFTTAYSEYALEAFDQQAIDYLLKPVRKERLQQALEHTQKLMEVSLPSTTKVSARTHITVYFLGALRLIPVKQIYYFKADQKYVTLRWTQGEVLIDEPLINLEKEFGGQFLRIHRNALVALTYVAGLEKCGGIGEYCIKLTVISEKLAVSRRHLSTVRKTLRDMRLLMLN